MKTTLCIKQPNMYDTMTINGLCSTEFIYFSLYKLDECIKAL